MTTAVVAFVGCGDHAPTTVGWNASVSSSGVTVTATDPDSATQDTTLDVDVTGSGFDRGSSAQWAIAGVPSAKIRTNSTRYVSSKHLVANITITVDADTGLYDVMVLTSTGKKGIGTELFAVKVSNRPVTYPARVSIPDAPTNALVSDGKASISTEPAGSYDDDVCGVQAVINGGGNSYLAFRPYDRLATSLKGPAGRRCAQHDSLRTAFLRLADTTRVRLASTPETETTLGALGYVTGERRDTLGLTRAHYLFSVPVGVTQRRQGGLNLAFCLSADGAGSPFRFATDLAPGSDSLLVTRTTPTHWIVETQPYPNNKGSCGHYLADGTLVPLLVHLDFRFEIDDLSP